MAVVNAQRLGALCLASLVEAPPLCADVVIAESVPTDGGFDVVLYQVDGEQMMRGVVELAGRPGAPTIVLILDVARQAGCVSALRGGVRGLVMSQSTVGELISAIDGVLDGHTVLVKPVLDAILALSLSIPPLAGDSQLSVTETEVLALLAAGRTVRAIAAQRSVSAKTVRNHTANIYRKLQVHSRAGAVLTALRLGLVVIPDHHLGRQSRRPGTGAGRRADPPIGAVWVNS